MKNDVRLRLRMAMTNRVKKRSISKRIGYSGGFHMGGFSA